jgi:DNA-binding CsgD family transcriptional regulator
MTNTIAVDPAHQRNSHVRTLTREVILDRLRNKPIADFFAHIEQLDESSAFVMLQFFGWLDTTRTEAYDTLPQMAYTGTLRRAVVKYMELDHIFGMEPAEPKQTIAQMVDSLTTYTVYKIGKMTLSPTSPRRIIAEAMGSGASVASDHLTERQQHILHLAAMHDHGQLTYTNDAIAAIIGINPRVVQTEIAVVAKLFGYTHYH